MAWFPRLRNFVDKFFHFNLNSVRVNSQNLKVKANNSIVIIKNPESPPVSIEKEGRRITINRAVLDKDQLKELDSILMEYYKEEGGLLKENLLEYSSKIDEYREKDPNRELIEYFSDKIPKEDMEILKISLFMRERFKHNENVSRIKLDIMKRFGDRGRNIANLCSADYFHNFIRPLWKAIHGSFQDQQQADQKFKEIYELIVQHGLLAIFVHYSMSKAKLAIQIQKKVEESKRYGFSVISDHLYIHALSKRNVRTVLKCIEEEGINSEIILHETDFITVRIPIDRYRDSQ